MVLKKVNDSWWIMTSDDGICRLTWFAPTRAEVLRKFKSYIREMDLERVRYRPRGLL